MELVVSDEKTDLEKALDSVSSKTGIDAAADFYKSMAMANQVAYQQQANQLALAMQVQIFQMMQKPNGSNDLSAMQDMVDQLKNLRNTDQ